VGISDARPVLLEGTTAYRAAPDINLPSTPIQRQMSNAEGILQLAWTREVQSSVAGFSKEE